LNDTEWMPLILRLCFFIMSIIKMTFDTKIAKELGTDSAIVFSNIEYWVGINKANRQNFFDGKFWTYNSAKAFTELFDYLSESQIKTCLSKLEKANYIEIGNYNKSSYDRTKWYSVVDKSSIGDFSLMDNSEFANGLEQNRQPIPYNKPNDKPNKEKDSDSKIDFIKLLEFYNTIYNRKLRVFPDKAKKNFTDRIKEGYLKEDIVRVFKNVKASQWHIDRNMEVATPEFLGRSMTFQMFASKEPEKEKPKDGHRNF